MYDDEIKVCMVVDDSPVIRKVAQHILGDFGYRVLEIESGHAALERCVREGMPDAMLLDWQLSDMEGHDFLMALMSQPMARKPYIVYATTVFEAEDVARAMYNGADDYIMKPFTRLTLQDKFASFARWARVA